jgi:hypothetical protein
MVAPSDMKLRFTVFCVLGTAALLYVGAYCFWARPILISQRAAWLRGGYHPNFQTRGELWALFRPLVIVDERLFSQTWAVAVIPN